MGNCLDEFEVRMRFGSDGKVVTAEYADGAGCGHSKEIDPYSTTVQDLIDYHLRHYKVSHRMEPKRMCGFELPCPGNETLVFVCTLEPHNGDDHELRTRVKK